VKNCKNMSYRLPAGPGTSRVEKPRPAGFFN
jgi:hypothetical protein